MSKTEMVPCIAVNRVNDAMPGDETEVPASAYDELLRQGVVRAAGGKPTEAPADDGSPGEPTLADLIGQIPEDEEYWTSAGKPTVEAFETLFGREVSAQERDEAWEAYDSGESA